MLSSKIMLLFNAKFSSLDLNFRHCSKMNNRNWPLLDSQFHGTSREKNSKSVGKSEYYDGFTKKPKEITFFQTVRYKVSVFRFFRHKKIDNQNNNININI